MGENLPFCLQHQFLVSDHLQKPMRIYSNLVETNSSIVVSDLIHL